MSDMSQATYVAGVLREWWDDATRTFSTFDAAGQQTSTRPYTAAEHADADTAAAALVNYTNERALRDKARAALAGNSTYLALAAPTNAQVAAQVKALTRQVNALIRLEVRALSETVDT